MKLSIIIINYNSKEFLDKTLRGVYSSPYSFDFETIVVDNHSLDGSVKLVKDRFPQVRVIRNTKNVGFARANNQAIARANGEYILFLNPDAVPLDGSIEKLVRFMEKKPFAGCVGGKLLNPDGSFQYSCRSFPDYISIFFGRQSFFRKLFPESIFSRKFLLTYLDYSKPQEVDWIMGACMLTKREVLSRVGSFDELFFLFVEDMDFCYRLKKEGYEVSYCPDAVFYHTHGAITKKFWVKSTISHNLGIYKFFNKNYKFNFLMRAIAVFAMTFRLFYLICFKGICENIAKLK